MEWPSLISAIAASTAAVLAGINLWFTGRREERKWRRESLVDTIVSFLDGSFKLPGNMAYNTIAAGGETTQIRARCEEGFSECTIALTRLRVLASPAVVQKTHELHTIDDTIIEILLGGGPLPPRDAWIRLADNRMAVRTAVIDAARKDLRLDRGLALEPSRHRVGIDL